MSPRERRKRIFRLPARDAGERRSEIDEELRFHLDMREAELVASGLSRERARAEAMREFGDVDYTRRYCSEMDERVARESRRGELLDGLWQDVRVAARQLRRNPGYAIAAVLTLALGIGATTAIFGAVNGVLLRPLPYADAEQLMTVWQTDRAHGLDQDDVSPANFLDWRERATSFVRLSAAEPFGLDYMGADGPRAIETWLVSDGFFEALGTNALLGRTFTPEEFTEGRDRAVVFSYAAWHRYFGGDPSLVGRTLTLDGEPHVVVGIMPPEFRLPSNAEAWTPKVFSERDARIRRSTYYAVIGRLRPGVTPAAAQSEMDAIAAQLAREHPSVNGDVGAVIVPLSEQIIGETRPALLVLLGAVGLLLLIACANVANLMLARAVRREHEFAIRSALGAGRGRLVRQLLTESVVVAAAGGAVGVLLARWGVDVIRALAPADLPRIDSMAVDGRVLAFALGVSLLTALLFGVAPALRAARPAVADELKASGRTASSSRVKHRLRASLVVGEIAMAMVLLVGAGLLARSFVALLSVERGYRTDHVLALTVQSWQYFPTEDARAVFVPQAIERMAEIPGVRAVGVTSSLPLAPAIGAHSATVLEPGREARDANQLPTIHATVATPGYFDAMAIAVRRGRMFDATDDRASVPVMLVSESFARRYWPGENPVGRRLEVTFANTPLVREVIGVVADVRQMGLHEAPRPMLYVPYAQHPTGALTFVLRTAGDPMHAARQAQEAIWTFSASMPMSSVTTLDGLLAESLRERRFHLSLLAAFSLGALLLSVVGIYGVLSQAALERTQEIGVRMALGAEGRQIRTLMLGRGVRLAAIGITIGLLGAIATSRLLAGMLFGVTATDPLTYLALALLVVIVAVVASYLPARRAARVDPLTALRAS